MGKTAADYQATIAKIDIELRALHERVIDFGKRINLQEVAKRTADLVAKKRTLRRALAELESGAAGAAFSRQAGAIFSPEKLLKAAIERRAIMIGGTGAINQIKTLMKVIQETDNILNRATYYYGPNASTNISVLTPMDEPESYAEGAADVKADTGAAVSVTEIQPVAYAKYLPISAEMIQMGSVDVETEVADIFAKAFATVMHRGMLTGTGTDKLMKGIFVSAKANTSGVTAAASSHIKVTELAALALEVSSKDHSYEIVMNPSVYQGILSDTQDTEDIRIYKEALIRDKTIEGVPIVLDAYAPKDTTEGAILAVACPLERYAIGVAGELVIKPIDVLGDTKTYYQGIMFFSGKQVSDTDFYSISAGKAAA